MVSRICILACAILLISYDSFAEGADKCNEAENSAKRSIDATYIPAINLWTIVADGLKAKGFDPRKYPVIMPDGSIEVLDVVDTVEKLARKRAEGYQQIVNATDDCNKAIAPYQKTLDVAVFFATGGLSSVLPPALTRIDASQFLSGKYLGGPNALIPKMRDDLLDGLGVGGDVACLIRDPLRFLRGDCS